MGSIMLYAQDDPLDGAMAMALDEVLLETATTPVLRTWRWSETTLSMGCFVRLAEARALCADEGEGIPVVRRWTGGGCVLHEKMRDFSYSLVFPRGCALARMRPVASYQWIHERLAEVLEGSGGGVGLVRAPEGETIPSRDCFRSPVAFDLLDATSGQKISGAGQKRTRNGLLHQGNIRGAELAADFSWRLAQSLELDVFVQNVDRQLLVIANDLREKKYASADWTEKY
jgi:lipoate-protein ligase A